MGCNLISMSILTLFFGYIGGNKSESKLSYGSNQSPHKMDKEMSQKTGKPKLV